MSLAAQVVNSISVALSGASAPFALHVPRFRGNESSYVQSCLESTFVSSVGRYVDQFERDLSAVTGSERAVAIVNGTAALHLALRLVDVQPRDEVIVPALTFVATANAVSYVQGVPHFVDSSERTLGIDPLALRDWLTTIAERSTGRTRNKLTGRAITTLVPMHTFGHPCDIDGMLGIAHDYRLHLVEDAAESLGSLYCGRHTGTFGRVGVLSFNGNKIVTTGGGGAILTNDRQLADYAKHLTTTAKLPHRWEYVHDEIGFNYRMPNLNAALGCAQLEQLGGFIQSKRRLTERYVEAFAGLDGIRIMIESEGCFSNYWLQTLILSESLAAQRDSILEATNNTGLMTRPAWKLLHELKPFKDSPRAPLPVAESLATRIINLPSSAELA